MIVGLDVGNGSVAFAVRSDDGKTRLDTYPSVFGLANAHAQDFRQEKRKPLDLFHLEGRDYLLGYESVKAGGAAPISAYDRDQRMVRKEFQTLTKLALLDAVTTSGQTGVIEVILCIGTPAEDFREEIIEAYRTWFKAPVVGAKNDQQVVVMVKQVEVVSQPIAVLMDAYYDAQGYVADEELEQQTVLVVDAGSGTLDLSEFDRLLLTRQISEPIGINDVYQPIIDEIERAYPKVRVDAFDLEHQLRTQDGQTTFVYRYGPLSIDISAWRDRAVEHVWERMVGMLSRRFPDRRRFHRVLLAGGTGQALATLFQEWMPEVQLRPDAQLAIAKGLLKYAIVHHGVPAGE